MNFYVSKIPLFTLSTPQGISKTFLLHSIQYKQYCCVCKRYQTGSHVLWNYYNQHGFTRSWYCLEVFFYQQNAKNLFPCFILLSFLLTLTVRSEQLTYVASGPNARKMVKHKHLNSATRRYFWSHPAIPPQRAFSFRSRLLKSTLLPHTAMF